MNRCSEEDSSPITSWIDVQGKIHTPLLHMKRCSGEDSSQNYFMKRCSREDSSPITSWRDVQGKIHPPLLHGEIFRGRLIPQLLHEEMFRGRLIPQLLHEEMFRGRFIPPLLHEEMFRGRFIPITSWRDVQGKIHPRHYFMKSCSGEDSSFVTAIEIWDTWCWLYSFREQWA